MEDDQRRLNPALGKIGVLLFLATLGLDAYFSVAGSDHFFLAILQDVCFGGAFFAFLTIFVRVWQHQGGIAFGEDKALASAADSHRQSTFLERSSNYISIVLVMSVLGIFLLGGASFAVGLLNHHVPFGKAMVVNDATAKSVQMMLDGLTAFLSFTTITSAVLIVVFAAVSVLRDK